MWFVRDPAAEEAERVLGGGARRRCRRRWSGRVGGNFEVAGNGVDVTTIKPGQFVIGSFFASDGTCPNCQAGYPSSCQPRGSYLSRLDGLHVRIIEGVCQKFCAEGW